MSTPQDRPGDSADIPDSAAGAAERDLEEIQRPMDDPQTKPALDPDVEPPATTETT